MATWKQVAILLYGRAYLVILPVFHNGAGKTSGAPIYYSASYSWNGRGIEHPGGIVKKAQSHLFIYCHLLDASPKATPYARRWRTARCSSLRRRI